MNGTRRLVSEVGPGDFGIQADATKAERIEAAVDAAARLVSDHDYAVWEAASWCADALGVEKQAGRVEDGVRAEVADGE